MSFYEVNARRYSSRGGHLKVTFDSSDTLLREPIDYQMYHAILRAIRRLEDFSYDIEVVLEQPERYKNDYGNERWGEWDAAWITSQNLSSDELEDLWKDYADQDLAKLDQVDDVRDLRNRIQKR